MTDSQPDSHEGGGDQAWSDRLECRAGADLWGFIATFVSVAVTLNGVLLVLACDHGYGSIFVPLLLSPGANLLLGVLGTAFVARRARIRSRRVTRIHLAVSIALPLSAAALIWAMV